MERFYEKEVLERLQACELEILEDFIAICKEKKLTYFATAGTGLGAIRHGGFIPWDDDIDVCLPRRHFEKCIQAFNDQYSDKYYILNADYDENYPLMTTRICIKETVFKEALLGEVDCPFGIFLDVYPYDNLSDNKVMRTIQLHSTWFFSKLIILRSIKEPYLAFEGTKRTIIMKICSFVHNMLVKLNIKKKTLIRLCKKCSTSYNHKVTEAMGFPSDTDPNWNTVYRSQIYPLRKMKFEHLEINVPNNLEAILTKFYGDDYMTLPPIEKRKTHYPKELRFKEEK